MTNLAAITIGALVAFAAGRAGAAKAPKPITRLDIGDIRDESTFIRRTIITTAQNAAG